LNLRQPSNRSHQGRFKGFGNTCYFNILDKHALALQLQYLAVMRVPVIFFLLTAVLAFFKVPVSAATNDGYLSNIEAERQERFYEVYLFIPHLHKEPSLQEMIFSPLTKEFKEKYRLAFGEIDTSSISSRSQSMGGINVNPVVAEQDIQKRKIFAEYMTKRLLEHHVDNYMKTQPQMRPVLEVKEKIQNVKVEVTKEVRLNIQYNFAGNTADFIVDNPYCDSKFSLEMDPRAFGPTEVRESRAWLSRPLNSSIRANTNVAVNDGIAYGDLTKSFARYQLATTLGLSAPFKEGGTSVRETKYIFAFSHTF